ncbi:MAG: toll/interleukin-1 receptor domain-containing protein, partial [Chloroflexi bacterium]|nr:toll/interleukin-1 receptor domain-containing protein [Chloroflexota bacterium]
VEAPEPAPLDDFLSFDEEAEPQAEPETERFEPITPPLVDEAIPLPPQKAPPAPPPAGKPAEIPETGREVGRRQREEKQREEMVEKQMKPAERSRPAPPESQAIPAKPRAAARPEQPFGGAAPAPLQPPEFSAFYPAGIAPGQAYALMAFVHLDSVRDRVREIAAGFAGMMGGQPVSSSAPGRIAVDIGSLITFVPQIAGITFNPAELIVTWTPPYQSATFLFTAPADLKTDLTGQVMVFHGPLIVGEIPVSLKLVTQTAAASPALNQSGELRRLDPVFASYSHRDSPVMEYFRRARHNTGQKMLVDVYDLRSGDHWADRLLEMIDQSAVFQLFWSQHSAQSTYCRKEWEYALRHLPQRPRFIQPVWWNAPMPSPPPELADLHFQRIGLPSTTRAQLVLAQVRGLFGR